MQGQKRSPDVYQELFNQYKSGKNVPAISRETKIPTQTLYKKFADMGGKKRTPKPLTLELAPQASIQKNKIVIMITDSSQVRGILDEVF